MHLPDVPIVHGTSLLSVVHLHRTMQWPPSVSQVDLLLGSVDGGHRLGEPLPKVRSEIANCGQTKKQNCKQNRTINLRLANR